jgi:hypothetical protein
VLSTSTADATKKRMLQQKKKNKQPSIDHDNIFQQSANVSQPNTVAYDRVKSPLTG